MYARISHMTDSQVFEQIGRKRAEYRERKKELAQIRAKAADLGVIAGNISAAMSNPERIRWWDGTPAIGRTSQHIVLTSAMFTELSESTIKRICDDIKRLDAVIAALRIELTGLDEDPERGDVIR
jgi:hypothetical protein